jgi:hypothetical protein
MRITFTPAQCLETWQEAINPTDAVAGLMSVTDAVLHQLPQELLTDARWCGKRPLLRQNYSKADHLTKAGSGQTKRKSSTRRRTVFSAGSPRKTCGWFTRCLRWCEKRLF